MNTATNGLVQKDAAKSSQPTLNQDISQKSLRQDPEHTQDDIISPRVHEVNEPLRANHAKIVEYKRSQVQEEDDVRIHRDE